MSPKLPTYNTPLLLLILSNIYNFIHCYTYQRTVYLYTHTNNNKCILSLWSIFILCTLNILFFCIYQTRGSCMQAKSETKSNKYMSFIVVCAVSCKRNDKTQFSSQHYFVHFVPLILWKHVSTYTKIVQNIIITKENWGKFSKILESC